VSLARLADVGAEDEGNLDKPGYELVVTPGDNPASIDVLLLSLAGLPADKKVRSAAEAAAGLNTEETLRPRAEKGRKAGEEEYPSSERWRKMPPNGRRDGWRWSPGDDDPKKPSKGPKWDREEDGRSRLMPR